MAFADDTTISRPQSVLIDESGPCGKIEDLRGQSCRDKTENKVDT